MSEEKTGRLITGQILTVNGQSMLVESAPDLPPGPGFKKSLRQLFQEFENRVMWSFKFATLDAVLDCQSTVERVQGQLLDLLLSVASSCLDPGQVEQVRAELEKQKHHLTIPLHLKETLRKSIADKEAEILKLQEKIY